MKILNLLSALLFTLWIAPAYAASPIIYSGGCAFNLITNACIPVGGAGTVTSVGLSQTGPIFTVGGSPVIAAGTLTLTLNTQANHLVLMGPIAGGPLAPTYRLLDSTDIPPLSATYELVANKDTDGTLSANSDVKYPSQKAVKTYADTKETKINLTTGSVPFAVAGGDLSQDNADFFWDNTNKRFLVGTNPTASPGDNGQINAENSGGTDSNLNLVNRSSNNALNIQTENANVIDATQSANASAGGASITLARSRGTINAKTQLLAGDVYGGIFTQGYSGTGFNGFGGAIAGVATQNNTNTASGMEWVFTTSPNGTNAGNIPRLIIDQDGTTEPGLDATYTLGKAGARWRNTRLSDLTISTVPYTNASGDFQSSAVTPTELGYVSGVTSAIQTQINTKGCKWNIVTKVANYTAVACDVILADATGGAFTITMPLSGSATTAAEIKIKKIDSSANTVSVTASGADNVEYAATASLSAKGQALDLHPDSVTNWYAF